MATLSTHVLDTALGRPAQGIPVTIERFTGSGTPNKDSREWLVLGSGVTDADGRVKSLLPSSLVVGYFRMSFDTSTYNAGGFYPYVSIPFHVTDANAHYHVPLLLSPFGISTYRGS
jgi:5-hydroxyisourate hydrolase